MIGQSNSQLVNWISDLSVEFRINQSNSGLVNWILDWSIKFMIVQLNSRLVNWIPDWSVELIARNRLNISPFSVSQDPHLNDELHVGNVEASGSDVGGDQDVKPAGDKT